MKASRGFTLLEVLVALAIFASVAAAVLTASARSLQNAARLEDKTLAGWIAGKLMGNGSGLVRNSGPAQPISSDLATHRTRVERRTT